MYFKSRQYLGIKQSYLKYIVLPTASGAVESKYIFQVIKEEKSKFIKSEIRFI